METITFERTQWPVGHGGFHTAVLQVDALAPFHYFFDCGGSKAGAQFIRGRLQGAQYDFGVLSHFHADHIGEMAHARVDRIFLPLLEDVDWLWVIAAHLSVELASVESLVRAFEVLDGWQDEGRVVWIRHGNEPIPEEDPRDEQLYGRLRLTGLPAGDIMSDQAKVRIAIDVPIVDLRFFNHRQMEAAAEFEAQLQVRFGELKNEAGGPYADVAEVVADLKDNPATAIPRLKTVLAQVYAAALKAVGRDGKVAPLNLSSLTLCTTSRTVEDMRRSAPRVHSRYIADDAPVEHDGWMLTGDLELTDKVWPEFHAHYLAELHRCLVFNIPHHASKNSMEELALACVARRCILLACLPSVSEHHPNGEFAARLVGFGTSKRPIGAEEVREAMNTALCVTRTWDAHKPSWVVFAKI